MNDEPSSIRLHVSLSRLCQFLPPRAGVALLLLVLVLSCSVRDPAGTRWTTTLSLVTQAETLRVSNALDSPYAGLEADSLLLFHQELDTVWANFGDSLLWRGAHSSMEWRLGQLDLHGLGTGTADLPFVAAWPQYAGLVGQTTRIIGEDDCDILVNLPAWPDMEWMSFASADFNLSVVHAWPFPLAWLELDLVNVQGLSLGGRRIEPAGGIPAGQIRTDQLAISGLVSRDCRVRVHAHHLPMPAAALIQNLLLELSLTQTAGQADSARAVIPAQHFDWSDSLAASPGMRIVHALSGPITLTLAGQNSTPLSINLGMVLPQLVREATGDSLEVNQSLAHNSSVQRSEDFGSLLMDDPQGLRFLRVGASGISTASAGLVTVRANDRVAMDLTFESAQLREFEGWFVEDLIIPILPSETEIDAWPDELTALDIEGLELRLHLLNNTAVGLQSLLLVGVDSGVPELSDTTYILQPALAPGDSLLVFSGMGSLPARLPRAVSVSGTYRVPAGTQVVLDENSRIGVKAISVPGRGRLRALAWRSLPEIHVDQVPEEAGLIRLEGRIENRLPAGGRVKGRVAATLEGTPESLFDIHIPGGQWQGGEVEAALDTLSLELSDAALAILRLPEWVLWYEFEADDPGSVVEIHAGQWLRVQSLIQVEVDVHPGEN